MCRNGQFGKFNINELTCNSIKYGMLEYFTATNIFIIKYEKF